MHLPNPTVKDLELLRSEASAGYGGSAALGSAAVGLANVATGRLDGCLEFRAKPWDCAAGYAICEGAGAQFPF